MKRIFTVILILMLTSVAYARPIGIGEVLRLKDEPCLCSFVDGTAFIQPDTDISAYAGTDGGDIYYEVIVYDSSGRIARGRIGSVGGGISYDSDLIVNGTMEADSDWISYGAPLPTVQERSNEQAYTGTYSRKFTVEAQESGFQSGTPFTTTTGALYFVESKIYPDDDTVARISIRNGGNTLTYNWDPITGLTQDAWNVDERYYTETVGGSNARIRFLSPTGVSSGTWYIDVVAMRKVLDCAATGVHLHNGTNQNWDYIHPSFSFNQASYNIQIVKTKM